jgi:hypothetical protein
MEEERIGDVRRGEERDKKEMRHQMQCEGEGSGWEGGRHERWRGYQSSLPTQSIQHTA